MKRFGSSDSLAAVVSISPCKGSSRKSSNNHGYSIEFQSMLDSLDEEDYAEEAASPTTEKKRRLNLDQVKALEKNFEVENKLEPERKLKLAEELGLQPRQVAIWFQNRRARWKTKQLEREFGALKANFDALKHDYSNLQQENEALTLQLKELKGKLKEENSDSSQSVKEEQPVSESENNLSSVQSQNLDFSDNLKDNNNNNNVSSSQAFMNWFQISDSRAFLGNGFQVYQPNPVKLEEQSFFTTDEPCNFFSVDQAPTLHWYFPEQ